MSVAAAPLRPSLHMPPVVRYTMSAAAEVVQDRVALIGAVIFAGFVIMAIFAPILAPFDPGAQDILVRLKPPFFMAHSVPGHWLGTDNLGRDILSRLIHGARVSLFVGLSVVAVAGSVGTVLGLISGYFGGKVDDLIQRITDIQTAFPGLLLALTILTMVGPSVTNIVIVLSINGWMVYCRMVRGQVLSLREQQYVEAAQSVGCKSRSIIFSHILPNLASPLLTLAILEMARVILAEAILSFLGMGVQPPDSSWGLMIAEGHDYLDTAWWLITLPGIAVALAVLSINVLASWLRTAADPAQRFREGVSGVV